MKQSVEIIDSDLANLPEVITRNGDDLIEVLKTRVGNTTTEEALLTYKVDLLEDMMERLENVDNAQALMMTGSFPALVKLLAADSVELRTGAAEVFAAVAQNNPPCQDKLLELGVLGEMLTLSQSDANAKCRLKSLHAVSCLVRGHPTAEAVFLSPEVNGYSAVLKGLMDPDTRTRRKALFFMRALLFSSPLTMELGRECGLFPLLLGLVGHDDVDIRESTLNALIELCGAGSGSEAAHVINRVALQEPGLGAAGVVGKRQEALALLLVEDPDLQVEADLCAQVQTLLTPGFTGIFTEAMD
jgi:hypothetical protein